MLTMMMAIVRLTTMLMVMMRLIDNDDDGHDHVNDTIDLSNLIT